LERSFERNADIASTVDAPPHPSSGPDRPEPESFGQGDGEPDPQLEAFLADRRTEADERSRGWSSADGTPDETPAPELLSPEGQHDRYADGAAALFAEGGDYAGLWNADRLSFDERAWGDLSVGEREQFARRLEAVRADAFNQEPIAVNLVEMEEGSYGAYLGSIEMNDDLTCEDSVRTIVHEGFHGYQETVIDDEGSSHPLRGEWVENDEHYVPFEQNPVLYAQQPLERDAFAAEDRFLGALTERLEGR
jgi:hypothetical protein